MESYAKTESKIPGKGKSKRKTLQYECKKVKLNMQNCQAKCNKEEKRVILMTNSFSSTLSRNNSNSSEPYHKRSLSEDNSSSGIFKTLTHNSLISKVYRCSNKALVCHLIKLMLSLKSKIDNPQSFISKSELY